MFSFLEQLKTIKFCCSTAEPSAKYDFNKKERTISTKNIKVLEKYAQGAAARNYTKKMKFEMVKEISDM